MSPRRALALLLAVAATALGALAPAAAQAQEPRDGDSAAVAVNTTDGTTVFELAFDIRKVTSEVVDQTNTAIAYSSCKECRTVAISIQILLVQGSPTTVTPQNVAVAVNDQCTLCDSLALAYQFAVGGGAEPVTLTPRGWFQLFKIKRELNRLPVQQLTDAEITTRVNALMDQVGTILDTELTTRPRRPQRRDDERERAPPGTQTTPPAQTAPGDTTPATTPGETAPAAPPPETTPGQATPTETTPATTAAPAPTDTTAQPGAAPTDTTTTTTPAPADPATPPASTTPAP
ncbi:MAG: putative peptide zinc metalloprotease protein [Solirubrobacteraceae bacterium]|jgi:putative peptide zinc metalloprotease protein|nr:putative peptide zinc metalloprotease protein [Solirubrobacteraceae bacterium]